MRLSTVCPCKLTSLAASLCFLCSQSATVQAAGYGINENSASYMGTGFAGRASNSIDASIAANNPAGISFVEGQMISAGSAVILEGGDFKGKYTRPGSPSETISGKAADFQKTTIVPFGHFVMPINEQFSFGLSGYGPYGIELDYDKNWPGKYFGIKTSVKVMNLQGTLSFKWRDDVAIAFGLIGSYVEGTLTQASWEAVPGVPGVPGVPHIDATVDGDDQTIGWNIGALWQVNEKTMIGAMYHSKLDFTLEGDIELESPTLNHKVDATLAITMPERMALSITHKLDSRWTVVADATWTRWSRFDEFYVKAKHKKPIDASSYTPMNWKDVWAFSVGGSYQINPQWLARAGYMRDLSPVDDKNRTVRSPDADRNWFTCGANWQATENLSIDLAYAYVTLDKGTISESKHDLPESGGGVLPDYGKLTGEYENSSHIVAAQLNYRF